DTVNMSPLRAVQRMREAICLSVQSGPRSRRGGSRAVPARSLDELPRRTRFRRDGLPSRWWLVLGLAIFATGSAIGSQGHLDPTCGTGGVAGLPLGAKGVDSLGGLALQPDGKLVIATTADSGSTVVRLTQSGDLDPTFAVGGKVRTTDPGAAGVVVDDGAIRVGGGGMEQLSHQAYLFVRNYDERGNVGGRIDTLGATSESIEPFSFSGAVRSAEAGRVLVLGK